MTKKTIRQQIELKMRESFASSLHEAFAAKFDGLKLRTVWSVFDMSYSTHRLDDKPFEPEQHAFIAGFEAAWLAAGTIVSSC